VPGLASFLSVDCIRETPPSTATPANVQQSSAFMFRSSYRKITLELDVYAVRCRRKIAHFTNNS